MTISNSSSNQIVYIQSSIKDNSGKEVGLLQTPSFAVGKGILYTTLHQFSEINFIHGDYDILYNKTLDEYQIVTNLFDFNTQELLASTSTAIYIDTIPEKKKVKKKIAGIEIRNSGEYHIPRDSNTEYRDYNRTEIIPSVNIMNVPLKGNVILTKNTVNPKFFVESYSLGIDEQELKKQLIEIAKGKVKKIVAEQKPSEIDKIRNINYDALLDEKADWVGMLNAYVNDSIKKEIELAKQYDKISSLIATQNLDSQRIDIESKLTDLQQKLVDTLNVIDSSEIRRARTLYDNYSLVLKNIDKLQAIKDKIGADKIKYQSIIKNQEKLEYIRKNIPSQDFSKNEFLEEAFNSDILSKKLKFLYGIRELRVGSSIINWNNNAGGLLHINGYNFEYQYKKISFGTYAGIEMNHLQLSRPFFQRDSIKRRVFGNYIGFELSKKWSSKIYYVFNSNKNPDKSKERKHIAGVEFIQSINKAELNYEFSVSVDNTMSRKMGYFGSTTMNYIKNNSILSIEASYKTLNYFSTNNLVNYSQNLNSNIKFEQRILKNQIQLNASVRFSNNFENDTLFAIKRTSTITGGCYINFKDLPYVQISASHNYILSQEIERLRYPTTQITLNVATGYTWKKNKTSYTVNAYYQFSQFRNVLNLTQYSVPIEVNYNNYSSVVQHLGKISAYVNINKKNGVLFTAYYLNSKITVDSSLQILSASLSHIFRYKMYKQEIGYTHQTNFINHHIVHTYNPSLKLGYSFKGYLTIDVTLSYFRNRLFSNVYILKNDFGIKGNITIHL